jgi:beta-lactam-binding protein with PASTA domain
MRTCQSCGRENPPDRDFCECGEYLRWEPTGIVEAVTPEVLKEHAPAPQPDPPAAHVTPAAPIPVPEPGNGAKTAVQPTPEPASATIVLRLPDGDQAIERTLETSVEPGQRARVLALVRNQSGIVDNYELQVEGMPDDWWSIFPDTVYLVPFGTGGTYEQEVEVHLHPPRSPEAESRMWELRVVAHSKAQGQPAASAPLALGIEPYTETQTKVRPERTKGRRKAVFDVAVRNSANAPVLVALEGSDPDGEMEFAFDRPPQEVGPGDDVNVGMRVTPPRQRWVGRPLDHRLQVITLTGEEAAERLAAEPLPPEVLGRPAAARRRGLLRRRKVPAAAGGYGPRVYKPQVHPPGVRIGPSGIDLMKGGVKAPRVQAPKVPKAQIKAGDIKLPSGGGAPAVPLMPNQALFRQKAWIGWWVLPLLLLLAIAAVVIYLLLPKNVVVPNVVGSKSSFDAEKTLTQSGLTLNPAIKQQLASAQPGTVLAQTPAPGKKASKGGLVALLVAIRPKTAQVPSIVGMNSAQADQALRAKNLSLGTGSPQPVDPAAKISSQIPAARQVVKQGTPINIFFKRPAPPDKVKAKTAAAKEQVKKTAAQAKQGGPAPALATGATAAAVAAAAAKHGIVPVTVSAFDAAKKGTVFGESPVAGTPLEAGQKLTLFVSAGFPQLAFDNGKDIELVDGFNGKKLPSPAKGPQEAKDPTWSPDATRLIYSGDERLFLKDLTKAKEPAIPITAPTDKFTDPAWAPTGDANVIAMAGVISDTEQDLCLGRLNGTGMTVKCKSQPGLKIGKAIHWGTNGKSIIAFGQTPDASKQGIVRWKTAKPFSPNPADWSSGHFITDTSQPGHAVLDAALSPDGKTLALVSNLSSPFFRLYLAKPTDFAMTNAQPTPLRACKVAWRGDSKELVVVQEDAFCQEDVGQLIAMPLSHRDASRPLNASGDNPAFQPLTLGG